MNGYRDYLRAVFVGAVLFLWLIFGGLAARGHEPAELDAWVEDWTTRAQTRGGPSPRLLEELRIMTARHPEHFGTPAPEPNIDPARQTARQTPPAVPSDVEDWRPLVSRYFATADVDRALCLIWHESRGNPGARNPRSSATGLFQILAFWETAYGLDRLDPAQNVELAAIIRDTQGWTAWAPYNRGLCR